MYLTAGTGLPGPYDRFDNPRVEGSPLVFADLIVQGGLIEAAVNKCTREVAARLRALKVPLDLRLRPNAAPTHGTTGRATSRPPGPSCVSTWEPDGLSRLP